MIKASYAEMQSSAMAIMKAAEDYQINLDSLYQIINNLSNNWQGTDNLNYINSVNEFKNDLNMLGNSLKQYGMFLNKAAIAISNIQEEVSNEAGRL